MWRSLQQSNASDDAAAARLYATVWNRLAHETAVWLPSSPEPALSGTSILVVPDRPPEPRFYEGRESTVGQLKVYMSPYPTSDFTVDGGAIVFSQQLYMRPATSARDRSVLYWLRWHLFPDRPDFGDTLRLALGKLAKVTSKEESELRQRRGRENDWIEIEIRGVPNAITLALNGGTVDAGRVFGGLESETESLMRSGPPAPVDPEGVDSVFRGQWLISKETKKVLKEYLSVHQGRPVPAKFGFGRYLYLSVVTITTLGFGDIVPTSDGARLAVGLEAVTGVVLAGLFLNALALRIAARAGEGSAPNGPPPGKPKRKR